MTDPLLNPETGKPTNGAPYRGPHVVLSLAEAERMLQDLDGDDAYAESIRAKVAAAKGAAPQLRTPAP